jgi:hypothetical protein
MAQLHFADTRLPRVPLKYFTLCVANPQDNGVGNRCLESMPSAEITSYQPITNRNKRASKHFRVADNLSGTLGHHFPHARFIVSDTLRRRTS